MFKQERRSTSSPSSALHSPQVPPSRWRSRRNICKNLCEIQLSVKTVRYVDAIAAGEISDNPSTRRNAHMTHERKQPSAKKSLQNNHKQTLRRSLKTRMEKCIHSFGYGYTKSCRIVVIGMPRMFGWKDIIRNMDDSWGNKTIAEIMW